MTLRTLLERLLRERPREQSYDAWVNIRDERWPWRHIVAAAERGECSVSKVGRRLMMRREDLDAWLAAQAIQPMGKERPKSKPESESGPNAERKAAVAHLLVKHGYRPVR